MKKNYYELIKEAKYEFFAMHQEKSIEEIIDDLQGCWTRKFEISIHERAALAAVILTGTVINWQFSMPLTRDCLRNFRRVRKILSDGKPGILEFRYEYTDDYGEWIDNGVDYVHLF